MRRQRPADFTSRRAVWCLDLHLGGETHRIASEPVDVAAPDGSVYSYKGGLEPVALIENLGRLKFTAPELSATIRVVLDTTPARIRARGHDWLTASADLYLTVVDVEDAALTVPVSVLSHSELWYQISGRCKSPEWGAPGAPAGAVTFSIEQTPWEGGSPLIPSSQALTENTHPPGALSVFAAESQGKRPPIIIGAPGVTSGGFKAEQGAPAYCARRNASTGNAEIVVVAHGWASAETVTLWDDSGASDTATLALVDDDEGNPVTQTLVTALSLNLAGTEFYTSWDFGNGNSGPFVDGARTAPQAAVHLLTMSDAYVDIPAWSALEGQVPTVYVDLYINDDSTAWEVLAAHVLPLIPVGYRYTRQGIAPVVYDPAVYARDTVAHVRTIDTPAAANEAQSGDWTPIGPMALETEPDEVAQVVSVVMAENPATSAPRDVRKWAPKPRAAFGRYAGRARGAAESGSLYLDQASTRGAIEALELKLAGVWDVPSADAVASWRTRLASMPTFSASYDAPLHWGWVQIGDALEVTDPARELDAAIAIVDSRELTPNGWRFVLLFDEDPIRDSRTTA